MFVWRDTGYEQYTEQTIEEKSLNREILEKELYKLQTRWENKFKVISRVSYCFKIANIRISTTVKTCKAYPTYLYPP
jgi:hypothetical protein